MHTRVAQQVSFILNHRKNKTTRENFGMRSYSEGEGYCGCGL